MSSGLPPFELSVDGFASDHFRVHSLSGDENMSEAWRFDVVTFEGGDPDKPLVVGALPNGTHPSPFALPGDKTRDSELGTSPHFGILNVKIGFGSLKPINGGTAVLSEASLVKHTASGRLFAVGWLNLGNEWTANRSNPITTRLSKTFDKYLTP